MPDAHVRPALLNVLPVRVDFKQERWSLWTASDTLAVLWPVPRSQNQRNAWKVNVSGEPITLEQIISFLLDCPMFGHLDPNELSRVVHIMQVQRLRDGQHVFREGEQGDGWYVIFGGQVAVSKRQEVAPEREIAVLGSGVCFGEMSILDGSPRSASVRSVGESVLFRFPRNSFERLLREENIVAYKLVVEMSKVLCTRQRRLTAQLSDLIQDQQLGSSLAPRVGAIVDETTVSE